MKEVSFGKKSLNRDLLKQLLFSSSEQSKQLIKLCCWCCDELILRADGACPQMQLLLAAEKWVKIPQAPREAGTVGGFQCNCDPQPSPHGHPVCLCRSRADPGCCSTRRQCWEL